MKIRIDEIADEGMGLEEEILPSVLDIETEEIKGEKPLRIKFDIFKTQEVILIKVRVEGSLELICSRCLERFKSRIDILFDLNYQIDGQKWIDPTEDIRQEIILRYSIKSLCGLECPGLCIDCGENLNAGKCRCGNGKKARLTRSVLC